MSAHIACTALDSAGHLVSVTVCYTATEKGPGRAARPVVKKLRNTKSDYVELDGLTRAEFIARILAVHELAKDYAPGVHSGPAFKMWFTGSKYVQCHQRSYDLSPVLILPIAAASLALRRLRRIMISQCALRRYSGRTRKPAWLASSWIWTPWKVSAFARRYISSTASYVPY